MRFRLVQVLSLSLLASSLTLPAWGQEADSPALRSAGRKLAQDGVALLQQSKLDEASQKLEKAYELLKVPSVALWSARALEQRGLLVEASERYLEAARLEIKGERDVQLQAQKDAALARDKLLPRIPSLTITVRHSGSDRPAVTLDGKPVPPALLGEEQPVNPGAHEIKATLGARQTLRQVTLKEAEKKTEPLDFDAAANSTSPSSPSSPSSPPVLVDSTGAAPADTGASSSSTRRTLGFVALGAGGAGLAVGTVAGVLALGKRGSLEASASCRGDVCLPSQRSEVDSLDTLRTVSTIGFIAGGVLATTGVVLLMTAKPDAQANRRAPQLALRVAPDGVTLMGAFQ
jgi:hypothetical protein